jgi:tetratricopeptide (TPR) repeat protein
MLAAAGVQAQTDWTLSWPAAGLPVLAALGLLSAAAARRSPARRPSALGEAALAAGLLGAVLLAAASAVLPWSSDRAWRAGQAALGAGDPAGALREAATARQRNPLSLRPLQLRALALASLGRRPEAVEALRRGTEVQPENPRAWKALAAAQRGDPAAARVAWIRVHVLDPYDPDARAALGIPADAGPPDAAAAPGGGPGRSAAG